jgi:glucokinase
VEPVFGRITPECLISGPGLRRLHRARAAAAGATPPNLEPAEIIAGALRAPDGHEAQTIREFWRLVGRFAGDMALTFLATGGVTLF